jgi:hypothetical protein
MVSRIEGAVQASRNLAELGVSKLGAAAHRLATGEVHQSDIDRYRDHIVSRVNTALHEAGHLAVALQVEGTHPSQLSLSRVPYSLRIAMLPLVDSASGRVSHEKNRPSSSAGNEKELVHNILLSLGGLASEKADIESLIADESEEKGWSDVDTPMDLMGEYFGDQLTHSELKEFVVSLHEELMGFFKTHRAVISSLQDFMLEKAPIGNSIIYDYVRIKLEVEAYFESIGQSDEWELFTEKYEAFTSRLATSLSAKQLHLKSSTIL